MKKTILKNKMWILIICIIMFSIFGLILITTNDITVAEQSSYSELNDEKSKVFNECPNSPENEEVDCIKPVTLNSFYDINSEVIVCYEVISSYDIHSITHEVEGFTVKTLARNVVDNKKIDVKLSASSATENNYLKIKVILTSGVEKTVNLYGISNEYGIYISQLSLDDAKQIFLEDVMYRGVITKQEYDESRVEMSRKGVIEESYTISTRLTRAASVSKKTYVRGTLQWVDNTGEPFPLRHVLVKIYDYDAASDKLLGSVISDNNGNYYFEFYNPDEVFDFENGGADIYVRVYTGDENAMVKRDNNNDYYYESEKKAHMNVATGSTTVLNLTIDMQTDWGRAFQISQALLTGRDFAKAMMGRTPEPVTLFYPTTESNYSSSNKLIRIAGNKGAGDIEPYESWDVVLHEYGHHIQYECGIIKSYGKTHWVFNDLGKEYGKEIGVYTAYSEAWASAFGAVAKMYSYEHIKYVATVNTSGYQSYNGAEFTYEDDYRGDVNKEGIGYIGECVEYCNLAVLWDIFDGKNDDGIELGYKAWWNITTVNGNKTMSAFINHFYSVYPEYEKEIGKVLSKYGFSPKNILSDTFSSTLSTLPPKFTWKSMDPKFANNYFEVKIYSKNYDFQLTRTVTENQIQLTQPEWDVVYSWNKDQIHFKIVAYQIEYPSTGGYVTNTIDFNLSVYNCSFVSGGVLIAGTINDLSGYVTIPSKIGLYTVKGIKDGAFKNCSELTGVTLPSTIETIGKNAFENCSSLAHIDMSQTSVTLINDYAFKGCPLVTIKFPQIITSIGEEAFVGIKNIPELPRSLTAIGDRAFADSELQVLFLHSTIESIGANAFNGSMNLTIYTDLSTKKSTWDNLWNSSNRPVIWGCDMSEDGTYIVSFTKTDNNPSNINAVNGINNPTRDGYIFFVWSKTPVIEESPYENLADAPNGKLYVLWVSSSCVAEGTLITLADGRQVPVESLTGNEMLLVWNLFTGTFDVAPILFIDSDPAKMYKVVNLYFSDGTSVKVISEHGFWDFDLNEYVFLREDAAKYVGHWFNKQTTGEDGNLTYTRVQLTSVVVQEEYTTAWSPVTYGHLCYYVNGMLSMPGATTGLINIFDVDAYTMKIIETAYDTDIAQYGLFTYEEFASIFPVPELVFEAFGGQYLKVAIGKGLITLEDIASLLETYSSFLVTD